MGFQGLVGEGGALFQATVTRWNRVGCARKARAGCAGIAAQLAGGGSGIELTSPSLRSGKPATDELVSCPAD